MSIQYLTERIQFWLEIILWTLKDDAMVLSFTMIMLLAFFYNFMHMVRGYVLIFAIFVKSDTNVIPCNSPDRRLEQKN